MGSPKSIHVEHTFLDSFQDHLIETWKLRERDERERTSDLEGEKDGKKKELLVKTGSALSHSLNHILSSNVIQSLSLILLQECLFVPIVIYNNIASLLPLPFSHTFPCFFPLLFPLLFPFVSNIYIYIYMLCKYIYILIYKWNWIRREEGEESIDRDDGNEVSMDQMKFFSLHQWRKKRERELAAPFRLKRWSTMTGVTVHGPWDCTKWKKEGRISGGI